MTVVLAVSAAVFAVLLHAGLVRWLPPRFYISAIGPCCLVGLVLGGFGAMIFGIVLTPQQWLLFACLVPSLLAAYALLFMGVAWDSPTLALVNEIADYGAAGMPVESVEDFVARHPFLRSRLDAMMKSGVLADDGKDFSFRKDVGVMVQFAEVYRRLGSRRNAAG
jgi:hypothetical protein